MIKVLLWRERLQYFFDVLTVLPIRKEITKLIPSNFHFLCIFLHKKIGVFFIITFVDWNTFILMSDLRNLFLKNRVLLLCSVFIDFHLVPYGFKCLLSNFIYIKICFTFQKKSVLIYKDDPNTYHIFLTLILIRKLLLWF